MMIDAGPDNGECVILIAEREQGFALNICVCDVHAIEQWGVVVEDSKEVVIIAEQVLIRQR
jgi:hypothetical protein